MLLNFQRLSKRLLSEFDVAGTHVDIAGIHQPCPLVIRVTQFAGELLCIEEQLERFV
jgi:hypothetical protein